jgi:hypothetical protein
MTEKSASSFSAGFGDGLLGLNHTSLSILLVSFDSLTDRIADLSAGA